MSEGQWLVKLKRTGFETVLSIHDNKLSAKFAANSLNVLYQTNEYYIEEWKAGHE
jgi:hypothetical protein